MHHDLLLIVVSLCLMEATYYSTDGRQDVVESIAEIFRSILVISDNGLAEVEELLPRKSLGGSCNIGLLTQKSLNATCASLSPSSDFALVMICVNESTVQVVDAILRCIMPASVWKPVILVFSPHSASLTSPVEISLMEKIAALVPINIRSYFVKRETTTSTQTQVRESSCYPPPAVYEVYSVRSKSFSRNVVSKLESSNGEGSTKLLFDQGLTNRDLAGIPIKGIVANYPGFEIESELRGENDTLEFVGGYSVNIFLDLAYALNFTPKPVQASGWMWKDYATGEWQGVGGQIMKGEGDIAVSVTVESDDRADFEWLPPVAGRHVYAFFVQPPASDLRDIFQQPFDFRLLWCAIALYLSIFVVMTVLAMWKRRLRLSLEEERDAEFQNNVGFILVCSVCLKGWYYTPKSFRLRWVCLCTAVFGFILYTAFSAALVSTLSSETFPIQNMRDLVRSPITISGDGYIPYVVTTLQKVHGIVDVKVLRDRGILFGLADAPIAVEFRKVAFLSFKDEFAAAYKGSIFTDYNFCQDIFSVQASIRPTPIGMFIRKDSPYSEHFRAGTTKMIERGVMHRRNRQYSLVSEIQCRTQNTQYRENLNIADLFSAYVFLTAGLIMAPICLACEKLYFSSSSKTRRRFKGIETSSSSTSTGHSYHGSLFFG